MNFVVRNLGWILLIIFFVFMLYLISNQNNSSIDQNKSAVEISKVISDEVSVVPALLKTKDIDRDFSNLMGDDNIGVKEMEKKVVEIPTSKIDHEVSVDQELNNNSFVGSVRDFFSLKGDFKESSDDDVVSNSGTEDQKIVDPAFIKEVEEELSRDLESVKQDSTIHVITFNDNIEKNLGKTGSMDGLKSQISDEAIIGKGNDYDILESFKKALNITEELEEKKQDSTKKSIIQKTIEEEVIKIGKREAAIPETKVVPDIPTEKKGKVVAKDMTVLKTYTVGVDALRLNNAWFTQKIATVYRGDTLSQLTKLNQYGCFKVKVVESRQSINDGKVGWACKYYMEGHTDTLYKYEEAASNYYALKKKSSKSIASKKVEVSKKGIVRQVKNTKIGSIYMVGVKSLKLNNKYFNKTSAYLVKGDSIEQLSEVNKHGCFQAVVHTSYNLYTNNKGKIGWVCQTYLK